MQRPNVVIFWDFENLPSRDTDLSGYKVVEKLRLLAHAFGNVVSFKAYLDPCRVTSPNLRAELQASGVSIIDCPHNGRKDMVDKMLITDMIAFAIDHPAPYTILLISGDGDYAYPVSTLRLRRYQVVLACPINAPQSLRAQASVHLDWNTEVLGDTTTAPSSGPNPPPVPPNTSRRRSDSIVSRSHPSSSRGILNEEDDYGTDFVDIPRNDTKSDSYPSSTRVDGVRRDSVSSRYAAPSDVMPWRQAPSRTPSKPFSPPASFRSAKSSPPTPPPPERRTSEPVFVTNGNTLFESSSKPSLPEGFPFLRTEPATTSKAQLYEPFAPPPALPIPTSWRSLPAPFVPAAQAAAPSVPALAPHIPEKDGVTADFGSTLMLAASSSALPGPALTPAASSSKLPGPAASSAKLPTVPASSAATLTAAESGAGGFFASSASPEVPRTTPARMNAAGPSNAVSLTGPARPVPEHFAPLIQSLEARASLKGKSRKVPRTDVGVDLAKHKDLYARAKVSKFATYIMLAVDAGIVTTGREGEHDWIELCPEWSSSTMFPTSS